MTALHPKTLEHLPVDRLTPYARNARTHSPEQIRQIAASMTEFGFTNPVLIDRDDGIIAGHGRVMAAKQLGLATVPCLRLDHLTEAQKRAYIIADNQLALLGAWDYSALMAEVEYIGQTYPALLDITGLEQEFIDECMRLQPQLPEKREAVQPITWTRILISLPTDISVPGLDDWLKQVRFAGGEVDFSGN